MRAHMKTFTLQLDLKRAYCYGKAKVVEAGRPEVNTIGVALTKGKLCMLPEISLS